jgi:hypothetical protein
MSRRATKKPSPAFFIHTAIACGAAIALLTLSFFFRSTFSTLQGNAKQQENAIEIGIEHANKISLALTIARKGPLGYAMLRSDIAEPIAISIPESWTIKEIGGVPFASVTRSTPEFGFVRLALPAKARLTIDIPSVPDRITFASPSDTIAKIDLTTLDLRASVIDTQTILLQNTSSADLW